MRLVELARATDAQRNLVGIEVTALAVGGEFIIMYLIFLVLPLL